MQLDFLQAYDRGGNKNSVNPFVTQMFLRASFAAWFNLLKKKQKEERRKEIIAEAGDDELLLKSRLRREGLADNNNGEAEMEAILVINEEEFDITDSEGEEEYDDEVNSSKYQIENSKQALSERELIKLEAPSHKKMRVKEKTMQGFGKFKQYMSEEKKPTNKGRHQSMLVNTPPSLARGKFFAEGSAANRHFDIEKTMNDREK